LRAPGGALLACGLNSARDLVIGGATAGVRTRLGSNIPTNNSGQTLMAPR